MKNKKKLTNKQKTIIALIINAFVVLSVIFGVGIALFVALHPNLGEYRNMEISDFAKMYQNEECHNKSIFREDKCQYEYHESTEAIPQIESMSFLQEMHFYNYEDDSFNAKIILTSFLNRSRSMRFSLDFSCERVMLSLSVGESFDSEYFRKYYKVNKEDGMKLADIVKACKDGVTEWEEKPYAYSDDRYFYEKGLE